MRYLTFILILFAQVISAQNNLLDQTISKIEFNQDTVKSVYDWVTENIRYDVKKLSAIDDGSISKKLNDFRTEEEYKNHLLKKVVESKKGVCQDYSLLFDAILKKLGYTSFVVEGVTKNLKGNVNRRVGHTWNAVKVNDQWHLYDPTWGAGYVVDEKRFVKEYVPIWYQIKPEEMIKTHMPFDPIWQLSSMPIDYNAFVDSEYQNAFEQEYNFDSMADEFIELGKKEKMESQLLRSQKMESTLRLVDKWRSNLKKNIGQFGISNNLASIDTATKNSQKGVELFNEYVKAKNKQFKGNKYSLENASKLLQEAKSMTASSLVVYKSVEVEDKRAVNYISRSISSSERLLRKIESEIKFLNKLKN